MNGLPASNSYFRYMQFYFGWFGSPILLTGDYPRVMRSLVDSKALRFYQSHCFFLVDFTESRSVVLLKKVFPPGFQSFCP